MQLQSAVHEIYTIWKYTHTIKCNLLELTTILSTPLVVKHGRPTLCRILS